MNIDDKIQRYLDPSDIREWNNEYHLRRSPLINYIHPYYNMKQFKKYKRFYGDGFLVVENGVSLKAILELDQQLSLVRFPELLSYTFINGVYVPDYFNHYNKLQALNTIYYALPIKPSQW